jgi:hypothetical protein
MVAGMEPSHYGNQGTSACLLKRVEIHRLSRDTERDCRVGDEKSASLEKLLNIDRECHAFLKLTWGARVRQDSGLPTRSCQ